MTRITAPHTTDESTEEVRALSISELTDRLLVTPSGSDILSDTLLADVGYVPLGMKLDIQNVVELSVSGIPLPRDSGEDSLPKILWNVLTGKDSKDYKSQRQVLSTATKVAMRRVSRFWYIDGEQIASEERANWHLSVSRFNIVFNDDFGQEILLRGGEATAYSFSEDYFDSDANPMLQQRKWFTLKSESLSSEADAAKVYALSSSILSSISPNPADQELHELLVYLMTIQP